MTNKEDNLHELLKTHSLSFHPVIDFKPGIEKIISINFSHKNKVLEEIDFENTDQLSRYMLFYYYSKFQTLISQLWFDRHRDLP